MEILDLKLYLLRDRICAWEFSLSSGRVESGVARPFKRMASMDKVYPSDIEDIPYTLKQLKAAPRIDSFAGVFLEAFSKCDRIRPHEDYENTVKQTFGEKSAVYSMYVNKVDKHKTKEVHNYLYIDFEAVDMKICGWYGVLSDGNTEREYQGIARPFRDEKRLRRKYAAVYADLLPYSVEDILAAPGIEHFQNYFIDMFRQARKIYTYGDTDAYFIKNTFGEHVFNMFKARHVDMSVKLGNRNISLMKACRLFGVEVEGEEHDPKIDVKRMMAYMEATKDL